MKKNNYLLIGFVNINILILSLFGFALNSSIRAAGQEELFVPIVLMGDSGSPEEPPIQPTATPTISPPVIDPTKEGWAMAGANPERTSWTPEEVRGILQPSWYRPFEPYILPRVQVIADYGTLFISTANGLYALNAETGAILWIYPTEMPLGHSPTVHEGIVYVGGFDHKLHAIDASTGEALWKFEAAASFDTNPLVIEGKVFAGNRDGYFYAIHSEGENISKLAWKYKTGGPIHFSAAYKDEVIFFASNDSHAYALDARTGTLIWKSAKLPGAGFHSWWPVIYREWVIFAGSHNYRNIGPGPRSFRDLTREGVFPNSDLDPHGTLVGPLGSWPGNWVAGTPAIDASKPEITSNGRTNPITEFYEQFPWRRTYFVLNRSTGEEYTTDFDGDGRPEYAPVLWFGNDGTENRYPPVVGVDAVLYQTNSYMSDEYIPGGHVSGWQIGTPYISIVSSGWGAVDEPRAYSAGGNLIYWNLCCDRESGTIDITIPNIQFSERYNFNTISTIGSVDSDREWINFSYNLPDLIPGYDIMTYGWDPYHKAFGGVFGGRNGSYGWHGDENPPIPYQGKIYMIRSNAIVAFEPQAGNPNALPLAQTVDVTDEMIHLDSNELRGKLATEIQKIINTGHLLPGYVSSGLFDYGSMSNCGDNLVDYWHNPGDMLYTLILALPHLPEDLQAQTKLYIQNEFAAYPPYQYNHIGWQEGVSRTPFDFPPEVDSARLNYGPSTENYNFIGWNLNPNTFYVLWKYADTFGGARGIFEASRAKLAPTPNNEVLAEMPHVHNAFIAGYYGYLELEKMAGYPESTGIRSELNRLLSLRASNFSKDAPDIYFQDLGKFYCRGLNISRNFMYLVPELSDYLREHAYSKVYAAIVEYEQVAPYWFVSELEVAFGEGVITPLYDYHSIFQAKALIMQEPQDELTQYIDVPAFQTGDLFYIQNLVAAIQSE